MKRRNKAALFVSIWMILLGLFYNCTPTQQFPYATKQVNEVVPNQTNYP